MRANRRSSVVIAGLALSLLPVAVAAQTTLPLSVGQKLKVTVVGVSVCW